MVDVKFWTLDVGREKLDVRRWTLDVGRCWTLLDVVGRCWTLDVRRLDVRQFDAALWTLDVGHRTMGVGSGARWDVRRWDVGSGTSGRWT